MAKGHWSFLHEWVIYDYLSARADEGTLRLRQVISSGRSPGRSRWVKVEEIAPIRGTAFPDIQALRFKSGGLVSRPAEVKFLTSLFDYHKDPKYKQKFTDFTKQKGFVLVAKHDYLPKGLVEVYCDVEVCELDLEDFITFCRENFTRLLNRQIKAHSSTRVWLMYQGPNFNQGINSIQPARKSGIWCPTENLTGFDLAPGDRILFYKTSGLDRIKLQNRYLKEGEYDSRWILKEICIVEVKSKIFSRHEYMMEKKRDQNRQLWMNDPRDERGNWRWNRVFEFKIVRSINIDRPMRELYDVEASEHFAIRAWEAFCFIRSREISLESYRDLLEVIA